MTERALTRLELAEHLHVSPRTIDRRREEGMPCRLIGKRTPRFYLSQVVPWLDAHYGGLGPGPPEDSA